MLLNTPFFELVSKRHIDDIIHHVVSTFNWPLRNHGNTVVRNVLTDPRSHFCPFLIEQDEMELDLGRPAEIA